MLLVTIAVGLGVAITSIAVFLSLSRELRSQVDDSLLARAQSVANTPFAFQGVQASCKALSMTGVPGVLSATGVTISLIDQQGYPCTLELQGDPNAVVPPIGSDALGVADGNYQYSLRTVSIGGASYRQVAVPVLAPPGQSTSGVAVVLTQSMADTNATLSRLGYTLLLVGLIGVVGAAAIGLAIARAGLRPVDRLTRAAEYVARTEELRPIAVTGHDELARLGQSFNAMLGALELSRQRQRQLVADAGHELRTPLTSLRTNLDLLAQSFAHPDRGLSPHDRDELLADVRAQVEELTLLVKDVVELARDASPSDSLDYLDFAVVVERAVERARRRAPTLTFDVNLKPWLILGDATALERAVVNLLDNAVKWSPANATVTVALVEGSLTVADEGPGIAKEDLPHVFDRFYRATTARDTPGSGLGLAIVVQAAERHSGTVRAGDAPGGGALFTFSLPAGEKS